MSESAKTEHLQPAPPDVAETEPPSVCPECGRPDSECEARPCYKPHPLRGHDAEPRLNEEIVFIRQLIDDARKHLQARMDSVNTWRDGTEESHRAAHAMDERAIGRKLPYKNAQEREQLAQIDERIGNKFCEDIVMLERIERILIGSATSSLSEASASSGRSESAQDNSRWQSIETAPKDGTVFLGGCAQHPAATAVWRDNRFGWQAEFHALRTEGQWKGYPPTHWMPLPSPPSEEK